MPALFSACVYSWARTYSSVKFFEPRTIVGAAARVVVAALDVRTSAVSAADRATSSARPLSSTLLQFHLPRIEDPPSLGRGPSGPVRRRLVDGDQPHVLRVGTTAKRRGS